MKPNRNVITDDENDIRWWTRSPFSESTDSVFTIDSVYGTPYTTWVKETMYTRPAMNINGEMIAFTSAVGAKTGASTSALDGDSLIQDIPEGKIDTWELTLTDENLTFDVVSSIYKKNQRLTINYAGAQGDGSTYLSAVVIADDGNVTKYGRIQTLEEVSGEVEIDMSGITLADNETLYVYEEIYTEGVALDYASELSDISLIASEENLVQISAVAGSAYEITDEAGNLFIVEELADTDGSYNYTTDGTKELEGFEEDTEYKITFTKVPDTYIMPKELTFKFSADGKLTVNDTVEGVTVDSDNYLISYTLGKLKLVLRATNASGNTTLVESENVSIIGGQFGEGESLEISSASDFTLTDIKSGIYTITATPTYYKPININVTLDIDGTITSSDVEIGTDNIIYIEFKEYHVHNKGEENEMFFIKEWDGTTDITENGNYVLIANDEVDESVVRNVTANVNLCLNGHSLSKTKIEIPSDASEKTLTIDDCNETVGSVLAVTVNSETSNAVINNGVYSEGIVSVYGTVTFNNGKATLLSAGNEGSIVNIYDGEISNVANANGTVNLYGTPVITGIESNVEGESKPGIMFDSEGAINIANDFAGTNGKSGEDENTQITVTAVTAPTVGNDVLFATVEGDNTAAMKELFTYINAINNNISIVANEDKLYFHLATIMVDGEEKEAIDNNNNGIYEDNEGNEIYLPDGEGGYIEAEDSDDDGIYEDESGDKYIPVDKSEPVDGIYDDVVVDKVPTDGFYEDDDGVWYKPEVDGTFTLYAATPAIEPNGGEFTGSQTIIITTGTVGAEIYYTIDGSEPNEIDGTKYNEPFTINSDTTVKAIAVREDIENSAIVEAQFTKKSNGGSGTTSYMIKFETNGGSKIINKTVTKNKVLEKPTDPTKDGYTFDGWYTDKELITAYDFTAKVTKSFTLYAKWVENQTEDNDDKTDNTDTPEWNNPFEDVKSDDWYYEDVKYATENGLFNGTTNTTFAPNVIITRAMMVTVLYRAEGEPKVTGTTTFEDVNANAYYAKAVTWAQANGIVKGYSETEFGPDKNIIREQIAAIMHRYAQYKGYDVSVGENTNILSYNDYTSISEYAIPSIQYAVGSGLMKGKTDTTINPKDNATRAEIATILHRFIEANK